VCEEANNPHKTEVPGHLHTAALAYNKHKNLQKKLQKNHNSVYTSLPVLFKLLQVRPGSHQLLKHVSTMPFSCPSNNVKARAVRRPTYCWRRRLVGGTSNIFHRRWRRGFAIGGVGGIREQRNSAHAKAIVVIGDMQSLVGFSVIPKCIAPFSLQYHGFLVKGCYTLSLRD